MGPASADPVPVYVTPYVVAGVDSISIHVNHGGSAYVRILDAVSGQFIQGMNITTTWEATPESSFAYGCGWDTDLRLAAPSASGPYYIRVDPDTGSTGFALFWVRETTPSESVLVIYADNTEIAYNDWGGASLYVGPDGTYSTRTPVVSRERPLALNQGRGPFAYGRGINFPTELRLRGMNVAYTVMSDLMDNAALYNQYPVWITWPHNEYWSREERQVFDDHLNAGGHWISMSGNEGWWIIEWDSAGTWYTCEKNMGSSTYLWHAPPENNPFNSLKGMSSGHPQTAGSYITSTDWTWTVWDPSHPIMAGVPSSFDMDTSFSYVDEVDGLELDWSSGLPVPSDADLAWGTPPDLKILATLPCEAYAAIPPRLAWGVIGTYSRPSGGTVVTFPIRNWGRDIWEEPLWTLTENAINWLLQKSTLAAPDDGDFVPKPVLLRPNPARDVIRLAVPGVERIRVFDARGRISRILTVGPDGRFSVRALAPGVWMTRYGKFVKIN